MLALLCFAGFASAFACLVALLCFAGFPSAFACLLACLCFALLLLAPPVGFAWLKLGFDWDPSTKTDVLNSHFQTHGKVAPVVFHIMFHLLRITINSQIPTVDEEFRQIPTDSDWPTMYDCPVLVTSSLPNPCYVRGQAADYVRRQAAEQSILPAMQVLILF